VCEPKEINPPESGMDRGAGQQHSRAASKATSTGTIGRAQQRLADSITSFAGSMAFVYLHLLIFGAWIAINLGWLGLPRFDPSFVILAMAASVEAIFLSTFVLISQNRLSNLSERRADLDLQIGLLAEHEVTRLLQITRAMAERMQIELPDDHEMKELEKDIEPGRVLDTLESESSRHWAHPPCKTKERLLCF
jgi:uncharacterized membrane protein